MSNDARPVIQVRVDRQTKTDLMVYAKSNSMTVQEVIDMAIENFLSIERMPVVGRRG